MSTGGAMSSICSVHDLYRTCPGDSGAWYCPLDVSDDIIEIEIRRERLIQALEQMTATPHENAIEALHDAARRARGRAKKKKS